VKPFDFPLLADENIHPGVVARLRATGHSVDTVMIRGLAGASDSAILESAFNSGSVVLTHDGDFGRLAAAHKRPIVGVIYLRPGHIGAEFVFEAINKAQAVLGDAEPPFLLTIERRADKLKLRLRSLPPPQNDG
jgi:predicted nuclease of predicted toxin-antitoxin system